MRRQENKAAAEGKLAELAKSRSGDYTVEPDTGDFKRPDDVSIQTESGDIEHVDVPSKDPNSGGGSNSGGDEQNGNDVTEQDTPTQDLPNLLKIEGPSGKSGEYSVKVSGEIQRVEDSLEGPDKISGLTATGTVGKAGVDKWRFSGDIEQIIGSPGVTISVNGQTVETIRGSGSDSSDSSNDQASATGAGQGSLGGSGTPTPLAAGFAPSDMDPKMMVFVAIVLGLLAGAVGGGA